MPFNDIEISTYSNEPIELYKFSRGAFNWLYTSSDSDITFEGNVYFAASISRDRIESTQDLGKTDLKIKASRRLSFISQFISEVPTDVIQVTITRVHAGDTGSAITWRGRLSNVEFINNEAVLTCIPLLNSIKRPGLRRVYQILCPHVLYGNECGAIKSSFGVAAVLSAVDGISITSSSFIVSINPTFDSNWFVGGYVDFVQSSLTTRRFIVAHDNVSGILTLNLSISGVDVGSTVTAYPGCDHTLATCAGKFSNALNYGGFPNIPSKNPMDGTPVF